MLRWPILVILFVTTILFIGLYKHQEEKVKMATIIVPGKPNVQLNVTLLINNTAF